MGVLMDGVWTDGTLPEETGKSGEFKRKDSSFRNWITADGSNGFNYLHQAYTAADPKYTGKVTVPTLWDKKTKTIVNNESSEIIRMLNSEFAGIAGDDTDYYPPALRAEIDRINETVYTTVNNGV